MEVQHVNVKIYVDGDLPVELERFIEIFHRWTADQTMDELLIDVADYRHVPNGPGVVLVGHEADYAIDHTGGRYGLLYNRKAVVEGSNTDRYRQALAAAARACSLLEAEFAAAGLRFSRHEFDLMVNDRALAPNTPQTLQVCQPELEGFLREVCGHADFTIQQHQDQRRRFGVTIRSSKPLIAAALSEAAP